MHEARHISSTPLNSPQGPGDLHKGEPMSHGRADLRKKPPARIAVVTEACSGCGGAPVCVDCCPVEACIYWIPDAENPPFGRVGIDGATCIGCAKCAARGPDGIQLDGCPWDAIEMVPA